MRTTLDLDENLLREIILMTGEKTKSKAVSKVLEEYARRKSIEEIRALAGNIDIDDNWRALEDLELKEQEELLNW